MARTKYLILILASALFFAVQATATTAAPERVPGAWFDPDYAGNNIESDGITFRGRDIAVDTAFCIGLRRFGVRHSGAYGLTELYLRAKCEISGADGHQYESLYREDSHYYYTPYLHRIF